MGRFGFLAVVGLLMTVHAFVVAHYLGSAFVIAAYCWGWVAVASLFGRLESVKSMAATMVVLLILSSLFLMVTPLGRGDTKGFYALAWFPSFVAFGCVYVYAVYLQRSDATPNLSVETVDFGLKMPSQPRDIVALRMEAEAFARQMSERAVGRERRSSDESLAQSESVAADERIPTFAVPKVA